jgi:hypothetical protein
MYIIICIPCYIFTYSLNIDFSMESTHSDHIPTIHLVDKESDTQHKKFFKYVPMPDLKLYHEDNTNHTSHTSPKLSPKTKPINELSHSPRTSDSDPQSHKRKSQSRKSADHFTQKVSEWFTRSRENSIEKSKRRSSDSTSSKNPQPVSSDKTPNLKVSFADLPNVAINNSANYETTYIDLYNITYDINDSNTYATFYILHDTSTNSPDKISILCAGMNHKIDSYVLVSQNYIGKHIFYDKQKHMCVDRRLSEDDSELQLYLLYSKTWNTYDVFNHYPIYVICHKFEIATNEFIHIYPQLIAQIQEQINNK